MSRKWLLFIAICIGLVALDQVTKIWVYNNIDFRHGAIDVIPGFFQLVHSQNPGALAGFLRNFDYRMYVFLGFFVFALGIILQMVWTLPERTRFLPAALGMVAAGAIGNSIDRIHKGTVTDFLRIYTDNPTLKAWLVDNFRAAEWPSFNVADMALVIGVGLFLVHYLFLEGDEEGEDGDSAGDGCAEDQSEPVEEGSG